MITFADMEDNSYNTLDDRHEIFNLYGSQCANCVHFINPGYVCRAFPAGIPSSLLTGEENHNSLIEGQIGNTAFQSNESSS